MVNYHYDPSKTEFNYEDFVHNAKVSATKEVLTLARADFYKRKNSVTSTLYEALFAPHAFNPSIFLTCNEGLELNYADFLKRVSQVAHAIVTVGLTPGDRIVVQAPKS